MWGKYRKPYKLIFEEYFCDPPPVLDRWFREDKGSVSERHYPYLH